jgi:hypothetical protein
MPDLVMPMTDLWAAHRALEALDELLIAASEQTAIVIEPIAIQAVVTVIAGSMAGALREIDCITERDALKRQGRL